MDKQPVENLSSLFIQLTYEEQTCTIEESILTILVENEEKLKDASVFDFKAPLEGQEGKNSLHLAAQCQRVELMTAILLFCPAAINAVDNGGHTALHILVISASGVTAAVRDGIALLLDLGVDKDAISYVRSQSASQMSSSGTIGRFIHDYRPNKRELSMDSINNYLLMLQSRPRQAVVNANSIFSTQQDFSAHSNRVGPSTNNHARSVSSVRFNISSTEEKEESTNNSRHDRRHSRFKSLAASGQFRASRLSADSIDIKSILSSNQHTEHSRGVSSNVTNFDAYISSFTPESDFKGHYAFSFIQSLHGNLHGCHLSPIVISTVQKTYPLPQNNTQLLTYLTTMHLLCTRHREIQLDFNTLAGTCPNHFIISQGNRQVFQTFWECYAIDYIHGSFSSFVLSKVKNNVHYEEYDYIDVLPIEVTVDEIVAHLLPTPESQQKY